MIEKRLFGSKWSALFWQACLALLVSFGAAPAGAKPIQFAQPFLMYFE